MAKCYYCERDFKEEDLNRKKIYDTVLQQTIEADVCEECENYLESEGEKDPKEER